MAIFNTAGLQQTGYGVVGYRDPAEGPREAPFLLDWSKTTIADPQFDIGDFHQQPQAPKEIACVYVDNSQCHQTIFISFPDTGFKITVPPFVRGYYPALTAGTRFTAGITEGGAEALHDRTSVNALNYFVPPAESAVLFSPNAATASTTFNPAAAAAGVLAPDDRWSVFSGILLQLDHMTAGAGGFQGDFALGTGPITLIQGTCTLAANEVVNRLTLLDISGLAIPRRGLAWSWVVAAGALVGAGLAAMNGYTASLPPSP